MKKPLSAMFLAKSDPLYVSYHQAQLCRTFEKTENFQPQPELQLIMWGHITTFPKEVEFKICNFQYFVIHRTFWPISFSKSKIFWDFTKNICTHYHFFVWLINDTSKKTKTDVCLSNHNNQVSKSKGKWRGTGKNLL